MDQSDPPEIANPEQKRLSREMGGVVQIKAVIAEEVSKTVVISSTIELQ